MPEPPERTLLHRLYDLTQGEEIHPFPQELYPKYLSLWKYLGSRQPKCSHVTAGFDYGPSGFEPDCPLEFRLEVRFHAPDPPEPTVTASPRTALYRLRDASDQLLYIGVSDAPLRRWVEHSKDKPWWPRVVAFAFEWYDSRTEALRVEACAIRTERPLYNQIHNRAEVSRLPRDVDPEMAQRMIKARLARHPHLKSDLETPL